MESRLITVDARRLTLYPEGRARRASGEAVRCYALRRTEPPRPRGGGTVLRLEDYRSGYAPARRAGGVPDQERPRPGAPERRPAGAAGRLSLVLECLATASIVAVALGVLIRFFAL